MPQPVADRAGAQPVIGRHDVALGIHVRDVGQGFIAEPVLGQHGHRGLGVQLAVKALRKVQLLVVGERLVAKHQHRVLVHASTQLHQGVAVSNLTQIQGADLRGKDRTQGFEGDSHDLGRQNGDTRMIRV